jgi:FlaA1/EpsC-like NDP-sugar epimerase
MTIPEACQLILQAGAVGKGREVYVLDMGEPVNIRYLAEQMILLSGKTPGEDIAIEYTGLLPGEKLNEELFDAREKLMSTPYPKLLQAQYREVDWPCFVATLEMLHGACAQYDEQRVRALTQRLVQDLETGKKSLVQRFSTSSSTSLLPK